LPKERPVEPTREQSYQRRIAELETQLRQRDEHIAALEQQVAQLAEKVAKLSRNSSNSSKPPSSDITKPPKPPVPPGQERPCPADTAASAAGQA
jgi:uncharacterized coiled-coil protein SlyX